MKRIIATLLLLIIPLSLWAQDDADVVPVPVVGLPVGSRVVAYATVATETRRVLVTEITTRDGTSAFYVYDYVDDTLRARIVGPRMIPGDLAAPPVHRPEAVRVDLAGERFWRAEGSPSPNAAEQLVTAPPLDALRYMEIDPSPWPLTPSPESALTIRSVSLAADGTVIDSCVLEPNIVAVEDRMTTFGSWWVRPFGEPHLLVGLVSAGPGQDRRGALRLYSTDFEVVADTGPRLELDTNVLPTLVRADLTGDGEDEMLFFATAQSPTIPLTAYRFARRNGARRALAFNLCSSRMNGDDVVALQRALAGRGFSLGPHGVDGWYGPDTRAAVIRFQREAGLPVTGVVESTLWRLLGM